MHSQTWSSITNNFRVELIKLVLKLSFLYSMFAQGCVKLDLGHVIFNMNHLSTRFQSQQSLINYCISFCNCEEYRKINITYVII